MTAVLDEYFLISERGSTIRREILGGFTTFLTISYVIFVNPTILSLTGMEKGTLVTVTCLATAIGSFLGGILGNVPIALAPVAMKLNILNVLKPSLIGAVFSFMFIDLFDSLSVLLSCYKEIPFRNEEERKKGLGRMLYADVLSTIIGSLLGTSTVTTYGESVAGITAGARTGLASIITGIFFLLSLFISPLVETVPVFAVAPSLVIVGIFMFRKVANLDFSNMKEAIPAFMTIIFMPMTHSIAVGLSFGFISYIVVHIVCGETNKISKTLWIIGILSFINIML